MKRIVSFLFAALCAASLGAQDIKESIVYLNGGSYWGAHNNVGAYLGLEYDRQLRGNWYWGARLSGTYYLGSPALVLCPAEFDYSFVRLGGETDINPWLTNYFGLCLGIGYRF